MKGTGSKLFRSCIPLALFALLLALPACISAPAAAYGPSVPCTILTDGPLGLQDGYQVYPLGMPLTEFEGKFGRGDTEASRWIRVGSDDDGKVTVMHLYLYHLSMDSAAGTWVYKLDHLFSPPPAYPPACVVTDKGIGPGATPEDVIAAHGKPVRADRDGAGRVMRLTYSRDSDCIEFIFAGDRLSSIVLRRPTASVPLYRVGPYLLHMEL